MILKASQRSGGQNLAGHLMRTDDNDHVSVHEISGFAADDLKGAFREAEAISRATKCKQYLYSLSLSPPEGERVPVDVFAKAIARIEKTLGLEGQPRAIVFHEKEGRRHARGVRRGMAGTNTDQRDVAIPLVNLLAERLGVDCTSQASYLPTMLSTPPTSDTISSGFARSYTAGAHPVRTGRTAAYFLDRCLTKMSCLSGMGHETLP